MRYLLDTNMLSALIRSPRGPVTEQIRRVGEARVYTSVIVEAELRYGAARKGSERLSRQVEAVLGSIPIEPWREPFRSDLCGTASRTGAGRDADRCERPAHWGSGAGGWQRSGDGQHEGVRTAHRPYDRELGSALIDQVRAVRRGLFATGKAARLD